MSFTKTAVALDYAQSNVTAHIQALEKELGVQLFDRLGKKVVLTGAGEQLLPYVEQIVHLTEEAKQSVMSDQEPQGPVRIGAPESVCSYRLAPLLQETRRRHPQVHPIFCPGAVGDLLPRLREGQLDLAFILDIPLQASDVMITPLVDEPILVLCGPKHPLAQKSIISAQDVAGLPMLLTESGCAYRILFEQALREAAIVMGDTLEFSSVEAIKQCVIAEMGFTVLPQIAVKRELEQGQLVALPWLGPPLNLQL